MFEPLSGRELVLITGARVFAEEGPARDALWKQMTTDLLALPHDCLVVTGGADGADHFAEHIAKTRRDYVNTRRGVPQPMPWIRYQKDGWKVSSNGERSRWAMGAHFTPFDRNERMCHRALWALKDGWKVHLYAYFSADALTFGTRHCFELAKHIGVTEEAGADLREWHWTPESLQPAVPEGGGGP